MVKDLFVNHPKQVSSAAVNVLDFITGNEDAVQCMPEILKESHRCCWFCVTGALCPSRHVPELPDHVR